jgi:outer membrane receptor protein involved in Fe transport
MKKLGLTIVLLGIIAFSFQIVRAEEVGKDESKEVIGEEEKVVKLEKIVVTAFPWEAVTITPRKTVIDVDKFTQASRTETVQDILYRFSGVDRMRSSATTDPQEMIFLRGFDDARFMVTMDGRPITGPSGDQDSFIDWSTLNTADIEKIEIIRSGASALYDASQGGIINIIRKKGKKYITLMPKISFRQDYGRFESYESRLVVDGGAGPLTYFLAGGIKGSEGYYRNNEYDDYDFSMRTNCLIPGGGSVTLAWKRSEYEAEYPVVNSPVWPEGVEFPNSPDYDSDYPKVPADAEVIRKFRGMAYPGGDSYEERQIDYYDLIWEQPVYKGTVKAHLYRTDSEEDYFEYQITGGIPYVAGPVPPDLTGSPLGLRQTKEGGRALEETTYGSILQYQVPLWEKNSLTVGWDYRKMETETSPDLVRIHAGYFEDIWEITNKLTLTAGLRYVHLRELDQRVPRQLTNSDLWLPKTTVEYSITPNTSVYLSANRDYRIPGC